MKHLFELIEVKYLMVGDRILLNDNWQKKLIEYRITEIYPSSRLENYLWIIAKRNVAMMTKELLKKDYLIKRVVNG